MQEISLVCGTERLERVQNATTTYRLVRKIFCGLSALSIVLLQHIEICKERNILRLEEKWSVHSGTSRGYSDRLPLRRFSFSSFSLATQNDGIPRLRQLSTGFGVMPSTRHLRDKERFRHHHEQSSVWGCYFAMISKECLWCSPTLYMNFWGTLDSPQLEMCDAHKILPRWTNHIWFTTKLKAKDLPEKNESHVPGTRVCGNIYFLNQLS